LIIGVIVGFAQGLFGNSGDDSSTGSLASSLGQAVAQIVLIVITLVGAIANTAFTTGMAGAAWERGTATLADGKRAFERDSGHIFVAMVGLFVLGLVAAILAVPTLGLALLAYLLFFIYTMPAAVVGERRGFDALAESARITTKRFWTTLIVVVLIGVIAVAAWFIILALRWAPFIGPLIGAILDEIAIAYFTLVVVGEYLNLRGGATSEG
jgi:hypothetical protein